MKVLLAGIALLLAASTAMAAESGMPDWKNASLWYIGAGGGPSSLQNACSTFESVAPSCDDESNAWKVFLGYNVYKYTALELQYTDAGEANLSTSTGSGKLDIHPRMFSTFLKFEVPIAIQGRLGIFAKLGINYYETDYSASGTLVGVYPETDDDVNTAIGAGITWRGWQHFSARFEWENFNDPVAAGGDVNIGSVSVLYHF